MGSSGMKKRDLIGTICQDEQGNVGIVNYVTPDEWLGVILMNGRDWRSSNPVLVAENIDAWVLIRASDLTTDRSWGMLQYERN